MPMLPSGRHVALDPDPLTNLTRGVAQAGNAHHLMAIEGVDDLFRWLDLLDVKPMDSLGADERARMKEVPGAPAGLVGVPTGVRLADWQKIATAWSDTDLVAMATFIDERVRPWLADDLALVRRCQEALLASPGTPAGMFAAMWKAGCHPLQDDASMDAELPPRDFEARLAALLRARKLLREHLPLDGVTANTRDRLEGVLAMCEQHLELPNVAAGAPLDEWIEAMHAADPLAAASEQDRQWFPAQIAIECETLWEGAGEALRAMDRELYDILELAALSGASASG